MSILVVDQQVVHYEVFGHGRPVLFLHGWLGSWRYWFPTIERVADHFRTYSFDFWGFGESDRKDSDFSVSEYVNMLFGFMDNMGLARVNLAGHGLGGMVAIRAASEQPERFGKLMTVNTPILGEKAISVRPGALLSRLFGRSSRRESKSLPSVMRQCLSTGAFGRFEKKSALRLVSRSPRRTS